MSHYTIVKADNLVYVDQEPKPVDCSSLPSYFHAIQWSGDANPPWGEIEYEADDQGKKLPNTRFSDFTPYQQYVDAWYAYVPPDNTNETTKPT